MKFIYRIISELFTTDEILSQSTLHRRKTTMPALTRGCLRGFPAQFICPVAFRGQKIFTA